MQHTAAASTHAHDPGASRRLGTWAWLREGIRSAFLVRSRVEGHQPVPLQLIAIVAAAALLELGLSRLEIAGPARFDLRGWLVPYWTNGAAALLVWAALWHHPGPAVPPRPRGVATWFTLAFAASLPLILIDNALGIGYAREVVPESIRSSRAAGWTLFVVFNAWAVLVQLWLGIQFGLRGLRLAAVTLGMMALYLFGWWQFQDRAWEPVYPPDDRPRLSLSQETFERQQASWQQAIDALAAQREDVADVFGIVFAPYAAESVFLRESEMVAGVLAERFDAKGRVLRLVNHATTAETLPWATPLNLRRAIEAVAQRMDREQDVLVLYLTSHGANNFRLASEHWPLQVPWLTPAELRQALDEAGVRHRVIAVSACYSGGWIEPLASESTLVMTAADAKNTSYGCGRKSELTFFGRALFDEQLRQTRSFEQAFAQAVPVIRRREEEAGKPDGFSNPQISVGPAIRPVLDSLAKRLEAGRAP